MKLAPGGRWEGGSPNAGDVCRVCLGKYLTFITWKGEVGKGRDYRPLSEGAGREI